MPASRWKASRTWDCFCARTLHLRDPGAYAVAREAAAHEDDEAVQARDPVAAVRERLDVELDLVVLRDRRGHAWQGTQSSAPASWATSPAWTSTVAGRAPSRCPVSFA